MPELPEVEVVRRGLEAHVVGRTMLDAELRGARVARRHDAGPADLAARLRGAAVTAADRRGKYLWLVVERPGDEPRALVVHLGMSGQMLVSETGSPEPKHLHARFGLGDSELRFVDQRTFGGLALHRLVDDPHGGHEGGVPEVITHIAPDPLEPAFDLAAVRAQVRRTTSGVKRVLLNQSVVSGIGNIYADEALWRARVHGEQPGSTLSAQAVRRVLEAAQEVMTAALAQGGTSFDALYVNVNGQSGYFDRSLQAYGQAGRPCARCGTAIVRQSFMNRGSHFCPRCQRLR